SPSSASMRFFYSRRRRHTRSKRDWSSDVCSSDLKLQLLYAGTDTIRGRLFQKRNDPIFGRELKQAIKSRNVKIKPRVTVVDGKKVTFSDGSSLDVNQIIWATGFVPAYE